MNGFIPDRTGLAGFAEEPSLLTAIDGVTAVGAPDTGAAAGRGGSEASPRSRDCVFRTSFVPFADPASPPILGNDNTGRLPLADFCAPVWLLDAATAEGGTDGRGVFEANCNRRLRSSSSIKSRSPKWTASKPAAARGVPEVFIPNWAIPDRSAGDANMSIFSFGDSAVRELWTPLFAFCTERGEIQIMLLPRFSFLLGDDESDPRGNPATSEKKNDVLLTAGVPGVLGAPALGVFIMLPRPPPGEKRPLADGECSHDNTLELSSNNPDMGCFP